MSAAVKFDMVVNVLRVEEGVLGRGLDVHSPRENRFESSDILLQGEVCQKWRLEMIGSKRTVAFSNVESVRHAPRCHVHFTSGLPKGDSNSASLISSSFRYQLNRLRPSCAAIR